MSQVQKIYPYRPPQALADNLWQVQGSLPFPVPRNMTVYRLPDGRLVLYSVVAMHEEGMRALEALGTPAIMIMPHDRHQMDAPFYKERYSALRVLAPDPSSARTVAVDGELHELAALDIGAYSLPGTNYHEVVLELPIAGGIALCATELLSNVPSPGGVFGLAMKLFGPPGGGFGVARAVRFREVVDRQKVRAWLTGLAERADTPSGVTKRVLRMVLVGHGDALTANVASELRRA
ncbi:MAG TPA: hypothetical protein VF316_17300, partial [Polyangiaceae bacterium]